MERVNPVISAIELSSTSKSTAVNNESKPFHVPDIVHTYSINKTHNKLRIFKPDENL